MHMEQARKEIFPAHSPDVQYGAPSGAAVNTRTPSWATVVATHVHAKGNAPEGP